MENEKNLNALAQVLLPSNDLALDIAFFTKIGFRLDNIFPADNPAVAMMSGHGMNIRIDAPATAVAPTIHVLSDHSNDVFGGAKEIKAPGGTILRIQPRHFQSSTPPTKHTFEVRRLEDNDPWVIGRAGMLYRDLIPDRLGGSIIASHIRIPVGGPVPDMVHYHTIGFQLIYCYSGWVKLVYEDQGPPFILNAGDCVTQPPEIRHQVLEASDNLEVIEIGVPAAHMTTIDHELTLPTNQVLPKREFKGQVFCHHQVRNSTWQPWRIEGFEYRDTGIIEATRGLASVQVARPVKNQNTPQRCSHNSDILFSFVLRGSLELSADGHDLQKLTKGDAFVVPPDLKTQITAYTDDLELLEVSLPGSFQTF